VENKPALWTEPKLYYVQDTSSYARSYCGDSVLWLRADGYGCTTNLARAMRVEACWIGRETDLLWSCELVDKHATRQLDMLLLDWLKREALHAK
jgi:hypothetical protein